MLEVKKYADEEIDLLVDQLIEQICEDLKKQKKKQRVKKKTQVVVEEKPKSLIIPKLKEAIADKNRGTLTVHWDNGETTEVLTKKGKGFNEIDALCKAYAIYALGNDRKSMSVIFQDSNKIIYRNGKDI